jgi:uncharacterized protein (DUF302 family)
MLVRRRRRTVDVRRASARALATRAAAAGSVAIGSAAVGALAAGAVAIGRLTVGRADVGGLRIRRLEIGELTLGSDACGMGVVADTTYAEAVERTRAALAGQGFGILTEIDVAATLHAKLGVEVPPQVILGACSPPLAHRALQVEPDLGLLLPCNVVVRVDGGTVRVTALDPQVMVGVTGRPELGAVAAEARQRLRAALDDVAAGRS